MSIDEAAQFLGYIDADHLEMQDLSEHRKWWELIQKLTNSTKRPQGYTPSHERLTCEDCVFMEWIGSGSKKQQMTYCTRLEENVMVGLEDVCDEHSEN